MPSTSDLGRAITESARSIHEARARGLQETLDAIADGACHSIPGFDHAGISTISRFGSEATVAATGELVWELDRLQYSLQEGPCVEAMEKAPLIVAVPDVRHEQRWPHYVAAARQAGLTSQLAVALRLDPDGKRACLNLYSTTHDEIHPDAEPLAELFAAHAAIALGSAGNHEHLDVALQSRKVIGQGLGILMERHEINEDRAFSVLVRGSSFSNQRLRDVAQELVDQSNSGRMRPTASSHWATD